MYRGADKFLARPGRETSSEVCQGRALSSFFFPLQCKAPKEIHAILTETLASLIHDRAKELSAPL